MVVVLALALMSVEVFLGHGIPDGASVGVLKGHGIPGASFAMCFGYGMAAAFEL